MPHRRGANGLRLSQEDQVFRPGGEISQQLINEKGVFLFVFRGFLEFLFKLTVLSGVETPAT